jgi:predicted neuraminidase
MIQEFLNKMRLRVLGKLGLVCLALVSTAQSTTIFAHEPLSLPRPMFNNHVANLSAIGGDSLICFWFGGINEGTTDNRIVYSLSTDKGNTWAPKTVLLDKSGSDTLYRDAVLWQNQNKFYLFFLIQEGAGGGSSAQSLDFAYISSSDRGATWSSPF